MVCAALSGDAANRGKAVGLGEKPDSTPHQVRGTLFPENAPRPEHGPAPVQKTYFGLGIVLLGIGWFYQRLLFRPVVREEAAPQQGGGV
jgi:hypothetical protein